MHTTMTVVMAIIVEQTMLDILSINIDKALAFIVLYHIVASTAYPRLQMIKRYMHLDINHIQ